MLTLTYIYDIMLFVLLTYRRIKMNFEFFVISITFGLGLAMDAFSVSLANGMNEKRMKVGRMCTIAGIFAIFQGLMPLIGWGCIKTISTIFEGFTQFIPYIALVLLAFIGGKMIYEGIKKDCDCEDCAVSFGALIVQGIGTSIDALSVGFEIGSYKFFEALVSSLVISLVTFIICMFGVWAGKKFGDMLSNKATVFGGIILVCIGIYIFVKGIL